MGGRCSSSGRVPALEAQSLEFKPYTKKKKKKSKEKKGYVVELLLKCVLKGRERINRNQRILKNLG
jgi:hypothetical protein